jgi:3-methylcrotonyl-CoA carboxylase beta subunit
MQKIVSQVKINSKEFRENSSQVEELLKKLKTESNKARSPESDEAKEKLKKTNKLPTSERITALLDEDSSLIEIANLAGLECYDGVPPGAGIYTCIGKISNRLCTIIANIPSVKGGTYFPLTVKKHLRALEISLENKLPVVYLVDSGGAYLPKQDEIFPDKEHFGRIFFKQAELSKNNIPQIATVLGLCTAGGAYIPCMSEQVIMVNKNSSIFLGGPQLVKAATGEIVTAEELGGAKIHSEKSGVADYFELSEESALTRTRHLISLLSKNDKTNRIKQSQTPSAPAYDPKELYGIVGIDLKKPISALEIIARIVDDSMFEEFKSNFGNTIKCGFAHINGYLVGIICNDGILFGESALKATHFISLCDQRRTPLLFLQNITGFMVGKEYEHAGIAKHGAKMVMAVANSTVPKYTIIVGGSYGAGNYAMCGRAFNPRFLYTWPQSRISVMGGTQAAEVLSSVKSKDNSNPGDIEKFKNSIEDEYLKKGNAFYASSQLWDDGIIDPALTRDVVALSIEVSHIEEKTDTTLGLFRM